MTNAMQITDATFARCQPTKVEMHLSVNAELPKRFGTRIKAAGGEYSTCRGYTTKRFVTVPISETELINELMAAYGRRFEDDTQKITVIFRGGFRETGRIVQYARQGSTVEAAFAKFDRSFTERDAQTMASADVAEKAQAEHKARQVQIAAEAESVAQNAAVQAVVAELVVKGFTPTEIAGIVSAATHNHC